MPLQTHHTTQPHAPTSNLHTPSAAANPHPTPQPPHPTQSDNAGVLVLSEFAGAAQSLGAGAILVNPWNIADVATVRGGVGWGWGWGGGTAWNAQQLRHCRFNTHSPPPSLVPPGPNCNPPKSQNATSRQAIEDALTMSEEERRERHRQNYMHVATHTAQVRGVALSSGVDEWRPAMQGQCTALCGNAGPKSGLLDTALSLPPSSFIAQQCPPFPTSLQSQCTPNAPHTPTPPQAWADTFISELNDTHIEADLRLRHTPPDLNIGEVGSFVV